MRSARSSRRTRLAWSNLEAAAAPPKPPAPRTRGEGRAAGASWPDILHAEPRATLDGEALIPLLSFVFAGGDASEQLGRLLQAVALGPSDWEADSFERHLFVEDLIRTACIVRLDGRPVEIDVHTLRELLTRPPRDPESRGLRAGVFQELVASSEARADLEGTYRELRRLRTELMRAAPEGRWEGTRRRLILLECIRAVVERLAGGFAGASSGLGRLRAFGERVRASEPFARLADLLDHEKDRARVALEVQLGGDGRVRSFSVQRISERQDNRFHTTALGRFFTKLSLWVRGFHFSDEELVERWIDAVYTDLEQLLPALLQLVSQVEFFLAGLGFRDECRARGLEVCLAELADDGPRVLRGLFNPLLFAQGVTPVPCNLTCGGAGTTTVVTGPNSGGKTRLLQSLGLTQMLGEAGFFVPASEARLRRVPGLFCSLVQEETFDQSEGRLGTELLRIRRVFEKAQPGALVILDELCSGTNPSEGEEIFMLVLQLLRELAPETFVTTHFLGFAARLTERGEELGVAFLQVELDPDEHPTFGFVPGVARTSLAAQAASRLGVTREELLALVRRHGRARS